MNIWIKMIENGNLVDIISCIFTIMALVFTLYFWLLDHLSEDETSFIKGRMNTLAILNASLNVIKDSSDPDQLLQAVSDVNKELEVILNYRFWARSKQKDEVGKINEFYSDSRYLVSTIRRHQDAQKTPEAGRSLVGIPSLEPEELEDIRSDYQNGLSYVIEFIENWR